MSGYCACANGEKQRASNLAEMERTRAQILAQYGEHWDRILGAPAFIYAESLGKIPQKSVREKAQDFMREWDWTQNLILTGLAGRGKTSIVLTMARMLREDALRDVAHPRYIRFLSMTAMQSYLRAGMDAKDAGQGLTYEQRIDALSKCALLICDDVGTEYRKDDGWWPHPFFDILYARYNANLPTWITTNLTLDVSDTDGAISGTFLNWLDDDDRLISRLMQNGRTFEVTGRDLRLARKVAGAKSLA